MRAMANLRHRVLPPQLLLKWPKEASFCQLLMHPVPETRPKMSDVLQSEFLNRSRNSLEEREAALRLREEIEEQELLLDFLLQLQRRKQDIADNLQDTVAFLSLTSMKRTSSQLWGSVETSHLSWIKRCALKQLKIRVIVDPENVSDLSYQLLIWRNRIVVLKNVREQFHHLC